MRTCSIYLLLLLAGIFASCDDFLDQSPKYNLTLENAVTEYYQRYVFCYCEIV